MAVIARVCTSARNARGVPFFDSSQTPRNMSQITQEDSTIVSSVVQNRAPPYHFPDPLPGRLVLGPTRRQGSYSDSYKGTWTYNGTERVVCIKCLRNIARETDPNCPNLNPMERFERVRCLNMLLYGKEAINLEYWQRIRRETGIWARLHHRNILPFFGYQVVDGQPRLVSPWMEHGNLNEYLGTHPDLANRDKLILVGAIWSIGCSAVTSTDCGNITARAGGKRIGLSSWLTPTNRSRRS